jgi:peroxiredoxin family protein
MEKEEKRTAEKADREPQSEGANFICSRGTLDGAYPALILATNAQRMGMEASVFFTFMGINVIRKGGTRGLKFFPPGFMGAIPGMASLATWMMKGKIAKAGIPEVADTIDMAQAEGVRLIACRMTVDMMGLKEDDFIEGVEIMTAEDFMKHAKNAKINMFT